MAKVNRIPLTGIEKTAILMNVLGKDKTYEVIKDLKDADVRKLLAVMSNMRKAPINLINAVLREFLTRICERDEIIFEENLTNPKSVSEALGEDRAKQIFGTSKSVNLVDRKQLTVLETIDPRVFAEFLVDEHPQTIALVIAHMEIDKQIAMIKAFPESMRAEIILRLSNLDYVSPEKIDELDEILRKELVSSGKMHRTQVGGLLAAADLVNALDKKTMASLMERLEDKDPILAEEIRQQMFTFTDIIKIDLRGIQAILREVPNEKLLMSLKGAPEEILDKFLGAMSERASTMLREDLGDLGPMKVSEVEGAQREVVAVVKRLEEEGKIVVGSGDEGDMV